MEGGYITLDCFFDCVPVEVQEPKNSIVEYPLCISRFIYLCLNSEGDSSEAVPHFTLEHGSLIPPV